MDNDTRQEVFINANLPGYKFSKRTAKQTFVESSYRATKFIKEKRNEHKIKKQNTLTNLNDFYAGCSKYNKAVKQHTM